MARNDPSDLLRRSVEVLADIHDPTHRARVATEFMDTLRDVSEQVRDLRRESVVALNDSGMGYQQIADLLGISKPRAQQLVNGWKNPKRPGVIEVEVRLALAQLHSRNASPEEIAGIVVPLVLSKRGGDKVTLKDLSDLAGVPQKVLKPVLAKEKARLAEKG